MPGIKLTQHAKERIELVKNYARAEYGERFTTDQVIDSAISSYEPLDFFVVFDGKRLVLQCRVCLKCFFHGDAAVAHDRSHPDPEVLQNSPNSLMSTHDETRASPEVEASSV